jgi:hypothetical protein
MEPQKQSRAKRWVLALAPPLALVACGGDPKDALFIPMPLEAHPVKVLANAEGTVASPAHVAIFLPRGSLQMQGGAESTLEGLATSGLGDPPPRVTLTLDRVAVTQVNIGGAPPKGDASFVFALGKTPMALEVESGNGQQQSIDLGGVALAEGRLHTESGHIQVDWSAPNLLPAGALKLQTEKGYIEARHVGRLGGGKVNVRTTEGFVGLEVGTFAGSSLVIDADVGTGKLVLVVPASVPARAEIAPNGNAILAPDWRQVGDAYILGDPNAAPRVVLTARGNAARFELGTE